MPIGTLTSIDKCSGVGPVFHDVVSFAGVASYTTDGDTGLKAALQKLRGDGRAPLYVVSQDSGAYVCRYDVANDKLIVLVGAGLTQPAGTTNLSGVTFKLAIVSK